MKEILNHLNKKLISKYDQYYIRFIGGQHAEIPCDIKITNSEADNIIDNPEYILDVFNDYRKKTPWSVNAFIKSGLEDYLYEENYSNSEVEQIIIRLNKFEEIKYEMYESVITEEFPVSGLVRVLGKTAKDIYEEKQLSIGDSYLELLKLAESCVC